MAGSHDTFTKFINLRDTTNLTNTRFTALCAMYKIPGMSDASLNRALQRKRFSNEVDVVVRPLILRIEDLIQRALPFKISFEDIESTKLVLDLLNFGVDVRVGEPISVNGSNAVEILNFCR